MATSLPPGLWLTSPAGWLPRTGISSGTLRSVIEYGLPFYWRFRLRFGFCWLSGDRERREFIKYIYWLDCMYVFLIVQTLLVRSVYTIYYAGGLTLYRCYLFVLFFIFPFISEPAHGRLLCCDELGVWCNFNILCLDSSPRPSFGEMGKLPHILPKIWRCPHLASCRKIFCKSAFDLIRLSTYKNGKIFSLSKEGYILVEKNTQVSLYPFFEEPWLTRWLPLAVRYHAISPVVRSFILYSSLLPSW